MIIVSGQVELFVEQREQEYILDTLGIGSTIGAYSVLNNNHYEYTGRAKNKVSCLLIKRQDLLDAAEKDHIMTEALDGATQYIVHNEIPMCDYSTLNNKDPIDTKSY
jgi:CRP-like cAMP-binding protein